MGAASSRDPGSTVVFVWSMMVDGILLNSVSYCYPNCEPFVKNCSLTLPRGSRCLLIGANGTGKTTLLQLIAGEWS